MDARALLIVALLVGVGVTEHVNRKYCRTVDQSKCNIHSMKMDPCPDGPGFCLLRRGKPYQLSFDFTPHFDADKLRMSIHSDDKKTGVFDRVVTPPLDACKVHSCPLEDNVRTVFNTDFIFDVKAYGKFPVEFRLWNENDESQACCFTFNVNVMK